MLPREDKRPCKLIYLCGSIDGVSKDESQNWRTEAYDCLSGIGVVCAVPGLEKTQLTPNQIVKLDDNMIDLCDTILVNLNFLLVKGEKRLGTGSLMELGMGFAKRKLIIGFVDGVLPEHLKFLMGAYDHLFTSMEEALNCIAILNMELE